MFTWKLNSYWQAFFLLEGLSLLLEEKIIYKKYKIAFYLYQNFYSFRAHDTKVSKYFFLQKRDLEG